MTSSIIGIFFFGVFLDVTGTLGKQELEIFTGYMKQNRVWLRSMIEENSIYFLGAASDLVSECYDLKQEAKSKFWLSIWELYKPFLPRRSLQLYHQRRDFFFSFVLINETIPLDNFCPFVRSSYDKLKMDLWIWSPKV